MKKNLTIFLLCLLLPFPCSIAGEINKIIFFGDSLTDNGNLYRLTNDLLPRSPPYYNGRFSNGPVWSEIFGHYLYEHYRIIPYNYATAGAMVVSHGIASYLHRFLSSEIKEYLDEDINLDRSHTLHVIWIGENDYLDTKITEMNEFEIHKETDRVIKGMESAINTLISWGGKYFMVFNLPDISRTPFGSDSKNREILKMLILMHNQKLNAFIMKLKQNHPEVRLIYHNIYTDFETLFNNPINFSERFQQHITNVTSACYATHDYGYWLQQVNQSQFQNNVYNFYSSDIAETVETVQLHNIFGIDPCPDAVQANYAFWDRLHPTAALHLIIAKIAADALFNQELFLVSPQVKS